MVRGISSLVLMLAVVGCSSDKPAPALPVGAEDLAVRKGMVFSQMPHYEELPVYKAAAYAGSGEAANALATFYMKADKSGQLQFYWTLVAAENGDPVGQYNAGMSYMDPTQDRYAPGRARFWLEKAARQEHALAPERLREILHE